jgi:type II protein arginine methyltransferase
MFDKSQNPLIFGVRDGSVVDIRQPLIVAEESNLHFCCVPLFNRRLRRDRNGISLYRDGPGTRSDRELESRIWITNVVGEISDWIDCDNPDAAVRKSSEAVLREEFNFGCHLGLQVLVLPAPSLRSPNYAAIIQQVAAAATYQQLWVRIPLVLPLDFRNARLNQNHVSDGWELWDSLRFLTGHHSKLFVALEITEDLPDDMNVIRLWAAEPLKAIILPTRIFLENKNGYPVLPKQHQDVLILLMRTKLHIIFSGRPKIGGKMTYYMQYIQHLHSRSLDELTEGEKFTIAYKDTLQSPLQPLMDNLESQTYETFERDPVKYERYEEAIRRALIDLKATAATGKSGVNSSKSGIEMGHSTSGVSADDTCSDTMNTETETEAEAEKVCGNSQDDTVFTAVVTVVGAGRGPLVAAALSAASKAGVLVTVFAVEKNANAVVTLRNRVITEVWSNVTILAGDMRMVAVPQLADILVSELLGSWGDNELSPECLDGAQRFLKEGGISIPCSCTSFVGELGI